ncbi:hypothetical protein BT63DRAFT_412704 [Microthyrium microscopicum]|uniref:WW domain-containing protein n=1 Tax=Microthyrium microscopicum TaxID=703497 RepID=A0A6A6UCB3_9PEZI|nr:hypothetical protein BT63DRAFT_412704 [Microthyrium microscopicum]
MLKSTHNAQKPGAQGSAPQSTSDLLPGWTEHKAPSGHTYYYHAETKKSTYTKPVAEAPRLVAPIPIPSYGSGQFAAGFAQSNFGQDFGGSRGGSGGSRGGRGGQHHQRRPEPQDRPKHRHDIPGYKPWILIVTKLKRRFVHNTETGESLWRFPEDVLKGVIEFDRIERERKERKERGEASEEERDDEEEEAQRKELEDAANEEEDGNSSEYTEVTDDEDEDNAEGPAKRARVEEIQPEGPIEFNEDDLAAELDGMDDYDFENELEEGDDIDPLSEEDSKTLFFDLLEDFRINPFKTWDKIIEEGAVIEDSRYTALPNMKSRREAWDEWSRNKIQERKEAREKEAKKDPKFPYLAFLQDHASTKLYWPEFKRKYRKESVMKDSKLPEKDREKLYREYVKRLQLPSRTLTTDLSSFLKTFPISAINRNTSIDELPSFLTTDLRFISVAPSTRDPLIETWIKTRPPPPENALSAKEEALLSAKRKERQRREQALLERERKVQETKKQQHRAQSFGKSRLREEEMEIERAMNLDRSGLRTQLEKSRIDDGEKSEGEIA